MPRSRNHTCTNCGTPGVRNYGHGWCAACRSRWDRAARPASGPPPALPAAETARRARTARLANVAGRREDFADLRTLGVSIHDAAQRVGVSDRTGWRYETARRAPAMGAAA